MFPLYTVAMESIERRKNMKQKEYQKLLELVCNKQDSLLAHGLWDSEEYKQMERLKVKLKKKVKKTK